MRTHSLKISILTLCTAISVLEASSSSLEDDIVDKIAHPKTTHALFKEKNAALPEYRQGRTNLVLALNNAIGPDFEGAARMVLGNSVPTDGITQNQITDILRQVSTNKKTNALVAANAQKAAAALGVRKVLGPIFGSLTINNVTNNNVTNNNITNISVTQVFNGQANSQYSQGPQHMSIEEEQVFPGGNPNLFKQNVTFSPVDPDKENGAKAIRSNRKTRGKAQQRLSYGEVFPLAMDPQEEKN